MPGETSCETVQRKVSAHYLYQYIIKGVILGRTVLKEVGKTCFAIKAPPILLFCRHIGISSKLCYMSMTEKRLCKITFPDKFPPQ